MALGFGRLGLAPEVFWSLTPRELAALLSPGDGHRPPARADLGALMRAHPDRKDDRR